jgi:formylglycine-generating enzyme required for sulfatase activity
MPHHRWLALLTVAFALQTLGFLGPLVADEADKSDKGKEDTLIAAMKFVKVPHGTFWMGGESGKRPIKQVEIKDDFELAAYTVTQEQWEAVMGNNPSHFSRNGEGKDNVKDIADADLKRFPVEMVSWNDAQAFLKELNEREKGRGWVYRLPTEAEWEYACRGGATSKEECSFDFYFDKPTNDLASHQANFYGDFPAGNAAKGPILGRTAKVGSYAPNKLGLYDMHGNVWQWCADLDAKGEAKRFMRGGSWCVTGKGCRAAHRVVGGAPTSRHCEMGMRLARAPQSPQWRYRFELKCRPSEQAKFELARTFAVEVFEDRGKALYVTETGMVAVSDFANLDQSKVQPPTWMHKLDLKIRPPGFEPPLKKFGLEIYVDEQSGHWMYIDETGAFVVVPGAGPFKPAQKKAKAAGWLHGLDLRVRKAGEKGFEKNTRAWGVEVFHDENNGNIVYIGDSGMLAVVPGARDAPAPTRDAKAPVWLNAFNLKVRKAGPGPAKFATCGLELFRDQNNGNLIYVSETGSLAVVPGKQHLRAPIAQPKPATLTRQFDLKCRKVGETEFADLAFGIAAYTDENTDW